MKKLKQQGVEWLPLEHVTNPAGDILSQAQKARLLHFKKVEAARSQVVVEQLPLEHPSLNCFQAGNFLAIYKVCTGL